MEFWSIDAITRVVGTNGVREYLPAPFGTDTGMGLVTDDTQMTLFTVEGLIRAHVRFNERGICHPPSVIHNAYQRWLTTQLFNFPPEVTDPMDANRVDGWLGHQEWLYSRRAPGNTCLSALEETRGQGFGDPAQNNSKGCGAVMRSAPFGLDPTIDAAPMAVECAALTHGHPTGQIASGALSLLIASLTQSQALPDAAETALKWTRAQPDGAETAIALAAAISASTANAPSSDTVATLGQGWVAEEALAIAVYCCLSYPEAEQFVDALSLSVTHSGDSDSTGAICGNILGAIHGERAIPADLLDALEGRETISTLANDFFNEIEGTRETREKAWFERYPGS